MRRSGDQFGCTNQKELSKPPTNETECSLNKSEGKFDTAEAKAGKLYASHEARTDSPENPEQNQRLLSMAG